MPGPPPKPPELRQRRNKVATRATLPTEASAKAREIPPLPPKTRGAWHPMVVLWWNDVWTSPMAAEYLEADKHGLYLLAVLKDQFWRKPLATLAAEIRQQEVRYGLTPIDRRRLQWEVEKAEAAEERTKERRTAATTRRKRAEAKDPRDLFKVVS